MAPAKRRLPDHDRDGGERQRLCSRRQLASRRYGGARGGDGPAVFILNHVALGGGPSATGWLIDHLAAFYFVAPDRSGLLQAVRHLLSFNAATFKAACPGGIGVTTGSVTDTACRTALKQATRQGVLLAPGEGLWDSVHHLLAALAMRRPKEV